MSKCFIKLFVPTSKDVSFFESNLDLTKLDNVPLISTYPHVTIHPSNLSDIENFIRTKSKPSFVFRKLCQFILPIHLIEKYKSSDIFKLKKDSLDAILGWN